MDNQKEFYYWLDPLRAMSAILVLICHARYVVFSTYDQLDADSQNIFTIIFFMLCSLGGISVCLFYILSGFLVGGKTISSIINGSISPRRFALNRLFRIGVPLSGALLLILSVNLILGLDLDFLQLFGQYLGLQCVLTSDYGGVFWTLPYEIWFYVILFAVACIARKSNVWFGAACFAVSLMVFSKLLSSWMYIIPLGVLCYYLKNFKITSGGWKFILWVLAVCLFIVYILATTHSFITTYSLLALSQNSDIIRICLFTVVAIILSQYVCKVPKTRFAVIINKYGQKMAIFSYSLFLTHYQVLKIWIAYGYRIPEVSFYSVGVFVGLCVACLLVAYIFYILFEKNSRMVQKWCEDNIIRYILNFKSAK